MTDENHLPELTEAARRAESIVSDQINSIVDVVQREADEIRRSAEDDAASTRREAMESAQRVLERLDALERPLGELVQTLRGEMDRVGRELEGPVAVEATAIAAPPESPADTAAAGSNGLVTEAEQQAPPEAEQQAPPEAEPEAPPEPEQQTPPEPEPEPEAPPEPEPAREQKPDPKHESAPAKAAEMEQGDSDTQTGDAPADDPRPMTHSTTESEPAKKKGRFRFQGGRFRFGLSDDVGRKGVFVTTQGHCAVCQKTFMAGTEENLALSDWMVSGDVGLCPECRADGWQLPDGARMPFRRGGR